jgi:hypothetical protein
MARGVAPCCCPDSPRDAGTLSLIGQDLQAASGLGTIEVMNDTIRRLLPVAAVFAASPAFACGGPDVSSTQMGVLMASMLTAPLLAALLVDRGAFALGAYATKMQRKHKPTIIGPVLALLAVFVTLAAVNARDLDLAVTGLAVVPVAAAVCGLSFIRSVIIEQRGQPRAQALRVVAVVLFGALAVVPFILH